MTLATGTIAMPLSGCLDFAGLRPDSDDDQSTEDAMESPDDESRDDEQLDDTPKTNSDDEADEEPNVDDESPDPNETERRDAGTNVLKFGNLQIIDYEEQIEELEYGDEQISYTGEVKNADEEAYESVVVEVRVYDKDGHELGSHRDLTPSLAGNKTWRFEVAPHSRPEKIVDHDIAVIAEQ
jgi:hypothetical protein